MKKTLLLLMAGLSALSVMAQQRLNNSVAYDITEQKYQQEQERNIKQSDLRAAHKTSLAPTDRWYSYFDYLDQFNGGATATNSLYLWNDTLSTDIYSDGAGGQVLEWNKMVSIGMVIDPYFGSTSASGFNEETFYPTATNLHMTSGYGYTVDSIEVLGIYGINPAKTSVVDTIFIGYTNGPGTLGSSTDGVFQSYFTNTVVLARYGLVPGVDSLFFEDVTYDSVTNKIGGTSPKVQYFTISTAASSATNANWGDTLTGTNNHGIFFRHVALNTPLNVPAGQMVGITLSFKSGDASFVTNDTVYTGHTPGRYRYNMFRPLIGYNSASSSSSTAVFAVYHKPDHNIGLFKTLPNFKNNWKDRYLPTWAWSSTGTPPAPSSYQYPLLSMHVKCPTCPVAVPEVSANTNHTYAYPNPANDELNISFNLYNSGNVTVLLTNVIGQVVDTKDMGVVTNGKAVFQTSAIPAGVYIYTVQTNGVRATGHIVVAH